MSQFSRPSSDIATGNWTTSPLWSKIDEASYDDVDYIQLNNSTSSTCQLGLSSVSDPLTSSNHIVRIRAKKIGTGTITLTGYLYEGTTQRATISITLTTSFATTTYTLTAGEADSITDYTALRLYLTGVAGSSSRYVQVSWAEFEVPNVIYPKSVDGTLNSSGTLSTKTSFQRALDGTLSFIGDLLKRIPFHIAGTLNSTGDLEAHKTGGGTTKYWNGDGTLNSSGTLTRIASFKRALSGTLNSVGVLYRQARRSLGGTLTSAGNVFKRAPKNVSGTLNSSGTLSRIASFKRSFAGTLNSTGDVFKRIPKNVAGTLNSSGILSGSKVALRTFTGTLNSTGLLIRQTKKSLTGTLTSSGTLSRLASFHITFSGTLNSAGEIVKQINRSLAGVLSSIGTLIYQYIHPEADVPGEVDIWDGPVSTVTLMDILSTQTVSIIDVAVGTVTIGDENVGQSV